MLVNNKRTEVTINSDLRISERQSASVCDPETRHLTAVLLNTCTAYLMMRTRYV